MANTGLNVVGDNSEEVIEVATEASVAASTEVEEIEDVEVTASIEAEDVEVNIEEEAANSEAEEKEEEEANLEVEAVVEPLDMKMVMRTTNLLLEMKLRS